jgi:PAS domain S-box-containing protein
MNNKLQFSNLSIYAEFLLQTKLREFTSTKIRLLKELKVPLFEHHQNFTSEDFINAALENTRLFLNGFTRAMADESGSFSVHELISQKFPFLSDNKILPEDITFMSFIHRKLFRDFLIFYTTNESLSFKIMEEIDFYTVKTDLACYKELIKLREKELNEKQNFIQKIAEITPSLITAYNIHSGKYIFVNNALKSLLGYNPEELMEHSTNFLFSRIHPEDLPAFLDKHEKAIASANNEWKQNSEIIVESHYRLRHKNGEYRWFNTYATVFNRDKNNFIKEILNISIDITDEVNAIGALVKTNEELRKSEERYQSMIAEVQDYSIILLNKEGIIENWNKGAEHIKGYNTEEVIGKHFQLFYTENDLNNNLPQQLLDFAILNGKSYHEGWRKRKDGQTFWGTTVITALHDKNDNITGFTKVTRDLTEIKKAEDLLKEYAKSMEKKNKQLEQVNKELESFNYIASHDLQEPLRKIQAFTSRLLQKEHALLSDWGKDVFGKIQSSANRMQRLIEALLNFSKLDKYEGEFIPTDINQLLQESKNNLADIIEEKHAIIESENLHTMDVIPIQFQQLLTNIINNALKYSKPNIQAHIKISSEIVEGKNIKNVNANDKIKYQLIRITDNGIGFDQQYSEKIFELFQRLHGKAEYEGTGIGLSICKKIVENHNGIINANGKPGIGSEFNLYFPIN